MTDSDYVAHLVNKIAEVDQRIARAQSRLETGEVAGRSRALAELTQLRNRHDDLVKRVATAKAKGADHWGALHTSFKEEADALADTLEKWLTRI